MKDHDYEWIVKILSPVPFGVGCYHPNWRKSRIPHVVNASPVPFGVGCYHPKAANEKTLAWVAQESPVPFGVGCYHP